MIGNVHLISGVGCGQLLRRIFPNLFPKKHSPHRDEHYDSGYGYDAAGVKRKAGRPPLKSESTEKKRYKVMAKKSVQKPKSYKVSPPELYSESDHKLNASRIAETSERFQQDDVSETENEPESDLVTMDAHKRIFTPDEVNVEDPPICVLCDDGGSLL